jgi:hypothetical protein
VIPVKASAAPAQMRSTDVTRDAATRSTNVARNVELLRSSAKDLGYTLDALEAAIHPTVGRAYIGKVLSGEKPLRLEFEVSLPIDLLTEYRKRQAEEYGLIVVQPLTGLAAQRAFVAGALGLLAAVPAKAAMAKADVRPQHVAVSA